MINISPQQGQALVAGMSNMAPPPEGPPPGPPGMPPQMPTEPQGPIPQGPVMAAPNAAPAKKPPLLVPPDMAQELAQGYVDQSKTMAQSMADFTGHPKDYSRMPLKDQVTAWNKRDGRQDPYALKEQGLSPTEIRDKVYPLRRVLLKLAGPRPKDRAKFAQKMQAESAKIRYDSKSKSFLS